MIKVVLLDGRYRNNVDKPNRFNTRRESFEKIEIIDCCDVTHPHTYDPELQEHVNDV